MDRLSQEVAVEYLSSLMDLTINSKPLINMLTILADENSAHAPAIVKVIEDYIEKVSPEVKLPILYLVDSIVKNVGAIYVPIFTNNIVNVFASAFQKVDEKTRVQMFKVRQTWNDIFPAIKLLALDVRIQHIDPNWPVPSSSIHLNPKFLTNQPTKIDVPSTHTSTPIVTNSTDINSQLLKQKEILVELQKQKEQLELIQKRFKEAASTDPAMAEKRSKSSSLDEAAKILSLKSTLKSKSTILTENSVPQASKLNAPRPKIAPVTSQLIEAAKSRDPRLARLKEKSQNLFGDKPSTPPVPLVIPKKLDVPPPPIPTEQKFPTSQALTAKAKEEEIVSRQLAMLKPPLLEQVKNDGDKKSRKRSDDRKRHSHRSHKESKSELSASEITKELKDLENNSSKIRKKSSSSTESKERSHKKTKWESQVPNNHSSSSSSEKETRQGSSKSNRKRTADKKHRDETTPEPPKRPSLIVPEIPPIPALRQSPPSDGSIRSVNNEVVDMDVEEDMSSPERIRFKKGIIRGRNYSRRNKETSSSPPPIEVVSPAQSKNFINPSPPKVDQTSEVVDKIKISEGLVEGGKDIRHVTKTTPVKPTEIPLERPATSSNSSEIILFGNKDTDERLNLPAVRHHPSPPPPPVISAPDPPIKLLTPTVDQKLAATNSEKKSIPDPEEDECLVEKIITKAESNKTSRPFRSRFDSQVPRKPVNGSNDSDWRRNTNIQTDRLNFDAMISNTQQQFAQGAISKEQYQDVMEHMTMLSEKQKIQEARRRQSITKDNSATDKNTLHDDNKFKQGDIRNETKLSKDRTEVPHPRRERANWQNKFNFNRQDQNRPDWLESDSRSQECLSDLEGDSTPVEVPLADSKQLDEITADVTKSISIDGTYRQIRFYGEHALAIMSSSHVTEIRFENGFRTVSLAGLKVECQLNGPTQAFLFKQSTHSVRLGAPTREVSLDGKFYEVHFGGKKIEVDIDGVNVPLSLSGPPPQVRMFEQSKPFCLGFVNLIVDAQSIWPIYIDTKPQRFSIEDKPIIIQLSSDLCTVLINNVPVELKFGGDPKSIMFAGSEHFLRLSCLPDWIIPGKTKIVNMCTKNNIDTDSNSNSEQPVIEKETPPKEIDLLPKSNQNQASKGPLDIFTSMIGTLGDNEIRQGFNYEVENPTPSIIEIPPILSVPPPPLGTLPNVNINELWQSLMKTGLVASQDNNTQVTTENTEAPKSPVKVVETIREINLLDSNSLQTLQPGLIHVLYSGIQCGSCGMRFAPEDTRKYSQHLDWHFRQNRKVKDAARRGASRRWYYDIKDWIQFQEIEDIEERAQSWFEVEGGIAHEESNSGINSSVGANGGSSGASLDASSQIVHSVEAPPGNEPVMCHLCRDRFDTFFNEETEEWHLRNCINVDGAYYHPPCHVDSLKEVEAIIIPKALPLIAALRTKKPEMEIETLEETITVDDSILDVDDGDVQIMSESEMFEITKPEIISSLVIQIIEDAIIEAEERVRRRLEDEELEVLAVKGKNEDKAPIDIIDVIDDGEVFLPQKNDQDEFDPNRKIKSEPLEMETAVSAVDQTLASIVSSIDGNVELSTNTPTTNATSGPGKIKITFTKTVPVTQVDSPKPTDSSTSDITEIEELDPPPLLIKPKKPRIAEREMRDYPTVQKGSELSGLCSIM